MFYNDFRLLSYNCYFDVVLAFLVVHQIAEKFCDQVMILEKLFALGDHVILEVANDVAIDLTHFIEALCKHTNCEYLGEVPRFQSKISLSTGKLYWFKRDKTTVQQGMSKEIYRDLNGVYTCAFTD